MPHRESLHGAFALLGGSFDPIHKGHLYLARQVLSLSPVHKVVLIPSFKHNFKGDTVVLDYETRLALAREAVDHYSLLNYPCFNADDNHTPIEVWDTERGESGYTCDLLRKLQTEYPRQVFAFIIGADNVSKLPNWQDFPWLKENAHFIILPRPDSILPCDVLASIKHTLLDVPLCETSSSLIRARIKAGQSIAELVPEGMEATILKAYEGKM